MIIEIHYRFPRSIRDQIKTVITLAQKKPSGQLFHPHCILGYIPRDVLGEIISKIECLI